MYYTVYLIKNQINKKIYIGVHTTENINDDYMGSGKLIKQAIKKNGAENFTKTILYICKTKEEAYFCEGQIVTEEFCKHPMTYNINLGGICPPNLKGKKQTLEQKEAKRKRMLINNPMKGRKHKEETLIKFKNRVISEEQKIKNSLAHKGKVFSIETKERMSKPKSATTKARMSLYAKTNNSIARIGSKIFCNFCQKDITKANYYRFHGDNCKYNINRETNIKGTFFNHKHTDESKLKMVESQKKLVRFSCKYCNIITTQTNIKRWHDEKCKFKCDASL